VNTAVRHKQPQRAGRCAVFTVVGLLTCSKLCTCFSFAFTTVIVYYAESVRTAETVRVWYADGCWNIRYFSHVDRRYWRPLWKGWSSCSHRLLTVVVSCSTWILHTQPYCLQQPVVLSQALSHEAAGLLSSSVSWVHLTVKWRPTVQQDVRCSAQPLQDVFCRHAV